MIDPADEFEFFFDKPWSDGLPVVPPTEERIARMLAGTSRGPDEPVGEIPPALEAASVRDIAVHAVMAGCLPEYLPVVLAGAEAMLEVSFNINGIQATMHAVAPLMIVNGPYAKKIGINGGLGCFGPGFRANATIGRAIRLILLNLGAGIPGVTSMSTFSQPSRFTFCIRENEEESPWPPLSESLGHGPGEDAVTLAAVENPQLVFDDTSRTAGRYLIAVADAMAHLGSWNNWTRSDLVVALAPQHAEICAADGLSKEDVHGRLLEMAGRRVGELRRGGNFRVERMRSLSIPVNLDDDEFFVPTVKDPGDLKIIVAGGVPGPETAVMHGWSGGSRAVSRAFSV